MAPDGGPELAAATAVVSLVGGMSAMSVVQDRGEAQVQRDTGWPWPCCRAGSLRGAVGCEGVGGVVCGGQVAPELRAAVSLEPTAGHAVQLAIAQAVNVGVPGDKVMRLSGYSRDDIHRIAAAGWALP